MNVLSWPNGLNVKRLRPAPTPEQLAAMYPTPHDHRLYGRGHDERVDATIDLALDRFRKEHQLSVADLSCGNGEIAMSIGHDCEICGPPDLHLGDIAGAAFDFAYVTNYTGPIEQTVERIPKVDTFVCSETIEHVDNPAMVLAAIRPKAKHLVLSTPLDCWEDTNSEHLWAWDQQGVELLMLQCDWHVDAFTSVDSREYGEPYLYGIWVAS